MFVHLKKALPAPPRNWAGCSEAYTPEDDALSEDATRCPSYGVDVDVQRGLASLRTDLDVFSDDEAYGLIALGYAMTKVELAGSVAEIASTDGNLERAATWPFAKTLERLGAPAAKHAMLLSLVPGRARFLPELRRLGMMVAGG